MRSLICLMLLVLTGCGEVFVAAEDDGALGGADGLGGASTGGADTGGRHTLSGGADATGGQVGATGGVTSTGGTTATGGAGTGGTTATGGTTGCTVEWLPDCRGIVYQADEELYADSDCEIPGVRAVYDVRYHFEPDPLKVNDGMCKASNEAIENVWVVAARDVAAYRWTWHGSSGTCDFVPSPQPVGGSPRVHVRLVPGVLDNYRLEGCM